MKNTWKVCLVACAFSLSAKAAIALVIGSAMAGCSDDTSGVGGQGGEAGGGGSGGGDDAFANCTKGDLEADFVQDTDWIGPGVDPETGELEPGNYMVATTYLALEPSRRDSFLEISGPVIETLSTSEGFVAAITGASESCSSLRTLTVWPTDEDMYTFVGSPAHSNAMSKSSELSRGTSNTISWEGDAATATWEESVARLGAEVGGDL